MRLRIRRLFYLLIEGLLIFGSVLGAVWARFAFDPENVFDYQHLYYKALVIAAVCQICFYYNDLYNSIVRPNWRVWRLKFIQALSIISLILAFIYYIFPSLIIGRGIFVITMVVMPITVLGWRFVYERISRMGPFKERILIVGTGALARRIGTEVLAHHGTEYEIAGFVDQDQDRVGESVVNPKVIGYLDQLVDLVRVERISKVVVAMPDRRGKLPITALLECKFSGAQVDDGVSFFEHLVGKILVDDLRPSWFVFSSGFKQPKLVILAKRALDILTSAVLLVLTLPLMAVVAILIRMESPGAALFRQKRVGEGGRIFTIYKFRSMRLDAEKTSGPVWAERNDPRVTRVGRFLRKSRLDELPQLMNVFRGHMSFVGPRPERQHFVTSLRKQIPYYDLRHSVKPGVTGWAQIKYPYGATTEDALEKLQYDLFYVKHLSLLLDAMIILETIKVVLIGRGAR